MAALGEIVSGIVFIVNCLGYMRVFWLLIALAGVWTIGARAQTRSMSLGELLELADKNSTSIRSFESGVLTAEAAVESAKAERLPDISASLSVSYLGDGYIWDRDWSNGMSVDMPHFGNNFALKVQQAVYTGGALSSGVRLAELGKSMAELESEGNREDVHFLLVGYYLQIFQLLNQERVFRENISLTEQVIRQMRARVGAGTALRNDITRFELQHSRLCLQQTQVASARCIVNRELTTIVGLAEEVEILPDTTIADVLPAIGMESDWQQTAAEGNVGLRKADLAVEQSIEMERREKSALLPKVAIVAEDYLNGPVTIEVPALDNNFNYWYVGLGVSYDLSSLWKSNKKLKEARLATIEARDRRDLARERVETGVQAAYTNLRTSLSELATQETQVRLANENYSVIVNRYDNDLALITDLVDAQNQKLEAEIGLVNAKIQVLYNYYRMLYVSGQM